MLSGSLRTQSVWNTLRDVRRVALWYPLSKDYCYIKFFDANALEWRLDLHRLAFYDIFFCERAKISCYTYDKQHSFEMELLQLIRNGSTVQTVFPYVRPPSMRPDLMRQAYTWTWTFFKFARMKVALVDALRVLKYIQIVI